MVQSNPELSPSPNHSLTTEFAIPLSDPSTLPTIQQSIKNLKGVQSLEATGNDAIIIKGTTPPSVLYNVLKSSTHLPVVLRGLSSSNPIVNSVGDAGAGVCIFESYRGAKGYAQTNNKGVARIVQVAPEQFVLDVSVSGLDEGNWKVQLRECGNLTDGCKNTGSVMKEVGIMNVNKKGMADGIWEVKGWNVWDVWGRSLVLAKAPNERISSQISSSLPDTNATSTIDDSAVCGIIARASGAGENIKIVCACSGQTLWEESRI